MQPTEGFSVSRRSLDVEDYIDVLRRHKGWIFGPFLFTLVASVVGVFLWPDSYVSEATVQVIPQQVPQQLVQSVAAQDMTQSINRMANEILSRTVLTVIIRNFDLYKREQNRMPLEDVIEMMRKQIVIAPVTYVNASGGNATRSVPAFKVSFKYEDRRAANRVVQELVSRFIDANQKERSSYSFNTLSLLRDQQETARKELDAAETKLTQFKMANAGRLPDEADQYMQRLIALQNNMQIQQNNISRAQTEKLDIETQINLRKQQIETLRNETKQARATGTQAKSPRVQRLEAEIENWEKQLIGLRQRYKDDYPDVKTALRFRDTAKAELETALAEEAAEAAKLEAATGEPVLPPQIRQGINDLELQIQYQESRIQAKNVEIEEAQKQLDKISKSASAAQSTLLNVPVGAQAYQEILREMALARDKYTNATTVLNRAEAGFKMEDRKQGETLAVLDSASLPSDPASPKRGMVVAIGAGIGILVGIVVAGAREMKDTSLKNLKDVRAYTQMAILGSVPLLENDFVVRRRKRIAWLGWTSACLMSVLVMAGAMVYYYTTKG